MSSEKAVAALLGKTHVRRAPQAMTEETRAWITRVLDDEYNRGLVAGIRRVERSAIGRELGAFLFGVCVAGFGMWRILA